MEIIEKNKSSEIVPFTDRELQDLHRRFLGSITDDTSEYEKFLFSNLAIYTGALFQCSDAVLLAERD